MAKICSTSNCNTPVFSKGMSPFSFNAISMLEAHRSHEEIIEALVKSSNSLFKKFHKAIQLVDKNYAHLLNED